MALTSTSRVCSLSTPLGMRSTILSRVCFSTQRLISRRAASPLSKLTLINSAPYFSRVSVRKSSWNLVNLWPHRRLAALSTYPPRSLLLLSSELSVPKAS
jgi:hypothetical protein